MFEISYNIIVRHLQHRCGSCLTDVPSFTYYKILVTGNLKRNGEIVIVRSGRVLAMNEWSRVKAGRFGRKLFLWVNGITNTGVLLPGESLLPSDSPLYLGESVMRYGNPSVRKTENLSNNYLQEQGKT